MSTENDNITLEQAFQEAVNMFVKQKGGKKGIVTKVDEDNLTCDVDPDDKSAPIVAASLALSSDGIVRIPVVGTSVSLVPMHMDSEEDGEFAVIEVSEIASYYINAKTEVIVAVKDGTIKLGSKDASEAVVLGNELISKLNELIMYINTHTHPDKLQPPQPTTTISFDGAKSEKVFTQ